MCAPRCLGVLVVAVVGVLALCSTVQAQTLEKALIFGSRNLTCPHPTEALDYSMVFHAGNNQASHDALAYPMTGDAESYGFEVIDPGNTGRNGAAQFGPFDDSPNNRNQFSDTCPEQIYDSFIGFKNFPQVCDDTVVGSCDQPCVGGETVPGDPPGVYAPSGGVFRVDLPNGYYRFVGVFGSCDNAHSNRVVVEDGGTGSPENIGPNNVVLLSNFRQQDYTTGNPQPMAAVGFADKVPPPGDGTGNDPNLLNIDENGNVTSCGSNSPVLEVTQGYLRIHLLQANGGCNADRNGGDIVLFEAWRFDTEPSVVPTAGVSRTFNPAIHSPGDTVSVTLDVSGIATATTVEETVPAGWTITNNGGGAENGNVLTFNITADASLTYEVQAPGACIGGDFSVLVTPTGTDCLPTLVSAPLCDPGPCGIQATGAVRDLLIIGPIALPADAGANCDDEGNFGISDYITNADGSVAENNLLVQEGDSLFPDFGVASRGAGVLTPTVDPDVNPAINTNGDAGELTVWRADANGEGYINFNNADNVGDPVDDYTIYGLTYLENTTGACLSAILEVGTDDAAKMLVNGVQVHTNPVCRGVAAYGSGDMVPVTLAPGENIVLVGVCENGGGTGVRLVVRDVDMLPMNDGRVVASCTPPASYPPVTQGSITRSVVGDRCADPPVYQVTLTATGVGDTLTVVETLPDCASVVDNGGGAEAGNTLTFTVNADGDIVYTIDISGCCPSDDAALIGGEVSSAGACSVPVGGNNAVTCCPFACDPAAEDTPPQLAAAFAFGSRNLTCETASEPGTPYTMIHHAGNNCDVHNGLAYDAGLGYGFEIINPGDTGRNCSLQFGPFDDSPNNRNRFGDECGEELYDSFIGLKNYTSTCDATAIGDGDTPCDAVLPAEGAIWRVDVPNGEYRFIAVLGEADNPHAHRMLAENGGSGGPEMIGASHVVLVNNFDQAQYTHGQARGNCYGCGVYARVGFNCRIPPLGDGAGADPQFVNFGPDGLPTGTGGDGVYGTVDDPPPESPILEVTEGYIRFHLLQGNSNNGPGGKNRPANAPPDWVGGRDPNGTDVVLIELWRVSAADDCEGRDEDTHCFGLNINGPDGNTPGTYTVTASAGDDNEDPIQYLFTADNGVDPAQTDGPKAENSAEFDLGVGSWTISVKVTDDCPGEAGDDTCTEPLEVVETPVGGTQKPGDENQDGNLDITDPVEVLNHLFLGTNPTLPCGDGSTTHPANVELLDANADGKIDISDAVGTLQYLFLGGPPLTACLDPACPCVLIVDCPDNPTGACAP